MPTMPAYATSGNFQALACTGRVPLSSPRGLHRTAPLWTSVQSGREAFVEPFQCVGPSDLKRRRWRKGCTAASNSSLLPLAASGINFAPPP